MSGILALILVLHAPADAPQPAPPARRPVFSLDDVPAYVAALRHRPDTAARSVSFQELWREPAAWRGTGVRVRGRIERGFRQPARAGLPPLSETWIMTDQANPMCLVHPTTVPSPRLGQWVVFEGTSLGLVTYESMDQARLAPLIVGPAPPESASPPARAEPLRDLGSLELVIAVGLGLTALAVILSHHARGRPARRETGPRPLFLDQSQTDDPASGVAGEPGGPDQ